MADTFTPFWGLTQPEVGASRDTWGAKLNNDLAALDLLLQALQPIGAMTDFAGGAAPLGWLLCDGSVHPIASFPRLFAAISNLYGGDGVSTFAVPDARARVTAGAGTTTGDQGGTLSLSVGQKIGDAGMPIAVANLPSAAISTAPSPAHTHPGSVTDIGGNHVHTGSTSVDGDHSHSYGGFRLHDGGADFAGGPDSSFLAAQTGVSGNHTHTFSTTVNGDHQHGLSISADGVHTHSFSLGSGTPLRVLPPTIGTTKIICCGPPSMQSFAGSLAPGALMRLMASPLRGMH